MSKSGFDLTDKRFGKIRVTERNGSKWKYVCDCGNSGEAFTSDIRRGKIKSCGCARFQAKDITHQRFGRLVAKEQTGEVGKMGMAWVCECDCGNTVTVPIGRLTNGHTRSCGCLNFAQETIAKRKETNKKYNINNTRSAALNRKNLNKNNKSGITGVFWDKREKKWRAQIMFKKKNYVLGNFVKKEDAVKARKEAEDRIHGEFLEWYESEYKPQWVVNKKE